MIGQFILVILETARIMFTLRLTSVLKYCVLRLRFSDKLREIEVNKIL